ncbi:MAG TPA: superoxide dismutase family protein [Myxococcaceae bacterium]|nr:superoxide dismutase family protein [Myxococcaceae bacterium]
MLPRFRPWVPAAVLAAALAVPVHASPPEALQAPATSSRSVVLRDQRGRTVGRVTLIDTAHGLVVRGTLKGVPKGAHAFHFHEVGKCEPPFKTAGAHFNPTQRAHGMMDPGGHHAGDLPNLVVPRGGKLDFEIFAEALTLADGPNSVLDADGTALVLHAKADDHRTQPSGDAGDRIACGVLLR